MLDEGVERDVDRERNKRKHGGEKGCQGREEGERNVGGEREEECDERHPRS